MKKSDIVLRILAVIIAIVIIIFVIIYTRERNSLEKKGRVSIGTLKRIYPYFKGGPDIHFYFVLDNETFESYNKIKDKDRNLKEGDKFFIKYLPDNKSITEIIRDKNNNIILFKDSLQIDSIKLIYERVRK